MDSEPAQLRPPSAGPDERSSHQSRDRKRRAHRKKSSRAQPRPAFRESPRPAGPDCARPTHGQPRARRSRRASSDQREASEPANGPHARQAKLNRAADSAGPASSRLTGVQARRRRAAWPTRPSCQLELAQRAACQEAAGGAPPEGPVQLRRISKRPAARQRSKESAGCQPDGDPLDSVRPTGSPAESSQRLATTSSHQCGNESTGRRVAARQRTIRQQADASSSRPRAHAPSGTVGSLPRHRARGRSGRDARDEIPMGIAHQGIYLPKFLPTTVWERAQSSSPIYLPKFLPTTVWERHPRLPNGQPTVSSPLPIAKRTPPRSYRESRILDRTVSCLARPRRPRAPVPASSPRVPKKTKQTPCFDAHAPARNSMPGYW